MEHLTIFFKKLNEYALSPVTKTENSAGYDLFSCEEKIILPKQRVLINTGISLQIPPGYYGRIAPRSGLALNHSIDIGGGVIDRGYTGPIGIIVINNGDNTYRVQYGERIAQIIFEKVGDCVMFIEIFDDLPQTQRGANGFGSTGRI